jgi:hypothetical protein
VIGSVQQVGDVVAAEARPVPGGKLSAGVGQALGEALCALPVQISALLIIAFALGLMALGGAVEFVIISAIL